MLTLSEFWVWDCWTVAHEGQHHLFFLKAPRSLGDPDRRHFNVTVGHAVSNDLRSWTLLPDALCPADKPAWDDYTTWTGSIVRGPDGRWHMFYTGTSRQERGLVQRIGRADSDDLVTWRRVGTGAVTEADARWYERLGHAQWHDEAWRDPWVMRDPAGDGWHMLLTARAKHGPTYSRGVIGHARSTDLEHWEIQPPLTEPSGFGQLEVPQVEIVNGRPVLIFSCLEEHTEPGRRSPHSGVWSAPAESLLGPYDIAGSQPISHSALYAARLVELAPDEWALLGFADHVDGAFVGDILDPLPVRMTTAGVVQVEQVAHATD